MEKMILKAVIRFNWRKKFLELLVEYEVQGFGIKWKWYDGDSFWKRETIFESFFWITVTQNQVFDRVFPLDVPLIPLVIARTALYLVASNLWRNELLKDWPKSTFS